MVKDVYTIVLTGIIRVRTDNGLTEYTVRGNLYKPPKTDNYCGTDKTFHIIAPLAQKLLPNFDKTIRATIERCTDNNNNAISGEFDVTGILEIEPLPFEQI